MPDRYRSLNPLNIVETRRDLQSCIDQRLPASSLARDCAQVAHEARAELRRSKLTECLRLAGQN
jgi:hypothetical protein